MAFALQKTRIVPNDSKSIIPTINDINKKYSNIKYNLLGNANDAGFIITPTE